MRVVLMIPDVKAQSAWVWANKLYFDTGVPGLARYVGTSSTVGGAGWNDVTLGGRSSEAKAVCQGW